MSRPLDLPPAERFAHGTRSRYVSGCRCDECRAANTRAYHERQARAKALAAELPVAAPAPAPQTWTAPDGTKRTRNYRIACPGVNGAPCPKRSHLRRDSKGGCCRACRGRLVWNGLVDAGPARRHLRALSRAGVGRDAVAAASDVACSSLDEIRTGAKTRIRASTSDRILRVDAGARADASTVPAARTWQYIKWLLEEGFTRGAIARRLGRETPALQLGRRRVLARTALEVEKLYRAVVEEPTW